MIGVMYWGVKCSFSCPDYLSSDTKALDHRKLAAAKPRATGEDQMINNSQVYKTITQQVQCPPNPTNISTQITLSLFQYLKHTALKLIYLCHPCGGFSGKGGGAQTTLEFRNLI